MRSGQLSAWDKGVAYLTETRVQSRAWVLLSALKAAH